MNTSFRPIFALAYFCFVVAVGPSLARAGSATWDLNPSSGDWNTAANWTPATVPDSPADTATFQLSNTTNVSISTDTVVQGITFAPGASGFTITTSPSVALTISGVGITNNSGITQHFVASHAGAGSVHQQIVFTGSATAGISTIFTNNGGGGTDTVAGGITRFFSNSTAGDGTFINKSATSSGVDGGLTQFFGMSNAGKAVIINVGAEVSGASGGVTFFTGPPSAGNATIINQGGKVSGAYGGFTYFTAFPGGDPTAGNATIINEGGRVGGAGGGITFFLSPATTADSATLIAKGGKGGGQGGMILFEGQSTGGTARVEVFGNGRLDVSTHLPAITIGSLEGTGNVFVGAVNLTVGSNNLSTVFSGVIADGGMNGATGGSLTKIGVGKLTLTSGNTYPGTTHIREGALQADGSVAGDVAISAQGRLGGTGIIGGSVVNSGIIKPGDNPTEVVGAGFPGTLTISKSIAFHSLSTYKCILRRGNPTIASTIVADGVNIGSDVPFTFSDLGNGAIAIGTVFTVIDNTSSLGISGRFSNLSNGLILTSKGTNFKVSYKGGTGNDLTLTVVP